VPTVLVYGRFLSRPVRISNHLTAQCQIDKPTSQLHWEVGYKGGRRKRESESEGK
jgi:hypothetical protein